MNKISMTLIRTVFLPVGSPPIGSVCEIKADIGKADIHVEGEQVYCLGEIDIIIDYLSFSENNGRHLFSEKNASYPESGGKEWQAMINLPFSLNEKADWDQQTPYIVSLGDIKWFMVAPRALEMEMEIIVSEQTAGAQQFNTAGTNQNLQKTINKEQSKDGGWQMVSIAEENFEQQQNGEEITASKTEEIAQTLDPFAFDNSAAATEENVTDDSDKLELNVPETTVLAATRELPGQKAAPEIVKIVFNEEASADDHEIEQAIADAQAEMKSGSEKNGDGSQRLLAMDQGNDEIIAADNGVIAVEEPLADETVASDNTTSVKTIRRSHGLPRLSIETQDHNADISAFNINIKLP